MGNPPFPRLLPQRRYRSNARVCRRKRLERRLDLIGGEIAAQDSPLRPEGARLIHVGEVHQVLQGAAGGSLPPGFSGSRRVPRGWGEAISPDVDLRQTGRGGLLQIL